MDPTVEGEVGSVERHWAESGSVLNHKSVAEIVGLNRATIRAGGCRVGLVVREGGVGRGKLGVLEGLLVAGLVFRSLVTVMLLEKSHLLFPRLLLRLILILKILHLFLEFIQKLLNGRLIFSC